MYKTQKVLVVFQDKLYQVLKYMCVYKHNIEKTILNCEIKFKKKDKRKMQTLQSTTAD